MPNSLQTHKLASDENLLQYSNAIIFLITLSAYTLLIQSSSLLFDTIIKDSIFWPGAGLVLGFLLIIPSRQWVWVIAAVAIGGFVSRQFDGSPAVPNIFWTCSTCIEPLLGATLIRRSGNITGALAPQANMFRFLAYAVVLAPTVGAGISSIGTSFALDTPLLSNWPAWFIEDSLGVLVIAPLFLSGIRPVNPLLWPREQIIFTVLLLICGSLILRNWSIFLDLVLPYFFLPFTLWAALRFGIRCTVLTIVIIATASALAVNLGYVPSQANTLTEVRGVTMMQVRLLIVSCTALVVAVQTHDLIQGLSNEKRLLRQAHRDDLTGLYNRAGLNFRIESSTQRRLMDKPLHLLICDLDSFKPVNDKHGHLAGDEVLIEVAARLSACIRDGDAAARMGGDEFVVLLDNIDSNSVDRIAGRIIDQIAKPIQGSFGTIELSISIGITQWEPDTNLETVIRVADQALYQAKAEGKNRFVWAHPAI